LGKGGVNIFLNTEQVEKNIAWLLGNGSAPVMYLTHKHLLGTPDDSELMRKLWDEVENSPDVQEIFSKQEEDGSWCSGGSWAQKHTYIPKFGYDPLIPKYVTTVWVLPFLGEIGYTARDQRVRRACDYVLSHSYFRYPVFNKALDDINLTSIGPRLNPCRLSHYMIALGSVGCTDDVKVEKGYKVLLCMQHEDGGWVWPVHYEKKNWTRSCPYSSYHHAAAFYYSRNPAYQETLVRGLKFLVWHLSTKKAREIQRFFFHGHSIVHELLMLSEFGVGLQEKAVKTILEWLMTMYDGEHGCFRYNGKPVSKYSLRQDYMDSRVAKYRLYHLIETDWLTYHVTRIAKNLIERR